MSKVTYREALIEVIMYLEGKLEIYDGNHNDTIDIWNEAWDEMVCTGYEPDTASGIRKYMDEQLG